MQIYIEKYGSGKPLVLFHGWGFDGAIWKPLLPSLERNYRVILVDLPGFGMSSLIDWQAFKLELLARLPEQFALAGWSLGGLYATRLAIEAPNRVEKLFNIASTPKFIKTTAWPGVEPRVFQTFYTNLARNQARTLAQFVKLQLQEPGNEIVIASNAEPDEEGLRAGLDVLLNWDLTRDLCRVSMPVHYLFGRLDAIIPHRTMNAMQDKYSNFNYTLFNKSAHVPFLSEQEEFLSLLERFIQ